MTKHTLFSLLLMILLNTVAAAKASEGPCLREVIIDDDIVRLSIPMTPVRGVNLIFPFALNDQKTSYSLSSDQLFQFNKAGNTRVVPVAFKLVSAETFGSSADLTIIHEGFLFSIELIQQRNGHCSNVQFKLSPRMIAKIEEEENKRRGRKPGELTSAELDKVEQKVNDELLTRLSDIVTSKKKTFKIHEESKVRVSKNEEALVYVSKVEKHGEFYLIFVEVENKTASGRNLILNNVQITGDSGLVVQGYSNHSPQMSGDAVQRFTFATLTPIPKTGLTLTAFTDLGELEVQW